jgi:hypothetical protein
MKIIPGNEVIKDDDVRGRKKRYLESDAICCICGAIVNGYWERDCIMCHNCGGDNFIIGKVSVDVRLLLSFHIEELRNLCIMQGVNAGTRAQMVVRILTCFYNNNFIRLDKRIDEILVRKIITRNKKRFWFVEDIDNAMKKVKKCNIKLVSEDDVLNYD